MTIENLPGNVANWLWIALILIGFSLFFTAYYFRHQSKQLNRALSKLYDLNQSCQQDALDFFDLAWPILHSVGCLERQAKIEWFGERKQSKQGEKEKDQAFKQFHKVAKEDMRFEIIFYITREANQQESIASLVIKTFLNILEQDLVLKQSEILTSQKRLERYQLFVQHEIKNIAQFIQLLAEQVQSVKDDAGKVKLVNRLTASLPVMATRARKTVDHMQQPLSEFYEGQSIDLRDVVNDVIQMYQLNVHLTGSVQTDLPRQVLLEVFKNVLGNFRDHPSSDKPLKITVEYEAALTADKPLARVTIQSEQLDEEQSQESKQPGNTFHSERMFEPFWTTSESGMGLGLFLSRELLKQLDGTIDFYQDKENNQFGFTIVLPGLVS